jgi:hypothetical protein
MSAPDSWSKRRFDWKAEVFKSKTVSRGAKNLAVVLCDTYAGRNTGKCWPGNRKLAENLCVVERTIQRYLAELLDAGWLLLVKIPRRRRGMQLAFPHDIKGFKHDNVSFSNTTQLTPKHDRAVAPYTIEPRKNQKDIKSDIFQRRRIMVSETEKFSLNAWQKWLSQNTDYSVVEIFKLLRKGDAYCFPCRFPESSEERKEDYKYYFSLVSETGGKCIG